MSICIISIDLNSTIKISLSDLEVKLSKWAPARKQIASHNPNKPVKLHGDMDSRLAILTDYVRQKNAAAASKLEPKQT